MVLSREDLLEAYRRMKTIREFEERVHVEFAKGGIPGFVHLYAGEEASAAGVCMHLTDEDKIASTHRGHGHCIAKGVEVNGMMAEIFGKRTGTCGGKGGSMHIADIDTGMLGANGIVGGGPPLVCGAALAAKFQGKGAVAVAFFGDGASNQGTTFESLNLASVWKLPAIFIAENNGYAEATGAKFSVACEDISTRAAGFGMPGVTVDGHDFFAVHDAMRVAVERARAALALLAAYVEEVRMGFDRWGHAAVSYDQRANVQSVTVAGKSVDLKPGDWVKLAGGLALKIGDKPDTNTTWMVLDNRAIPDFGKLPSLTPMDGATPAFMDELEKSNRIVSAKKAYMADYMRFYDVTLMNPKVLVGLFVGAMSTFVFCALTMKAVGRAAKGMVEEVRRQFREKPGIMLGTETPDYATPVEISTKAAQREMILPSVLALAVPVVTGLLLGVGGVMGLLVGGLTTGFCVAVFMANAGGAWDNAKKHIESGVHGGKGSDAHKAAVVGDTVGDPFKDTSGPSLNILVKLMSMVSVVVAGLVVRYSLEALGIF